MKNCHENFNAGSLLSWLQVCTAVLLFKIELFEDHGVHGWVIFAIKVNIHKSQHSDLYEVIFKFEKKI